MTTIEWRVSLLETSYSIGRGEDMCPLCGAALPLDMSAYKPYFRDHREGSQDEWCAGCGRPLVIVLRWEA
jgi:hypothetical protein